MSKATLYWEILYASLRVERTEKRYARYEERHGAALIESSPTLAAALVIRRVYIHARCAACECECEEKTGKDQTHDHPAISEAAYAICIFWKTNRSL